MAKQPNILFILVDQMRPDTLDWNSEATPNLSDLREEGVEFTQSYAASPLCQPSRASIITGKYPMQHNICGNRSKPISKAERSNTFTKRLHENGYYTALIGKHHFYDYYNKGINVTRRVDEVEEFGFDYVHQVVDLEESIKNDSQYTEFLKRMGKLEEFRENFNEDFYFSLNTKETVDGYIGEKAVDYIENYKKDAPLYLNIGFIGPHPPHWVSKEFDIFTTEDVPKPRQELDDNEIANILQKRAKYLGQIASIDHYIGKVKEKLQERNMWSNTVTIFASDHGHNIGDYSIMTKRFFYEQSVKVPLIIAAESYLNIDKTTAQEYGGSICKALVSLRDIYPTVLEIAGIKETQSNTKYFPKSLLRIFNETIPRRKEIHSELGTALMVRNANWKLVFDPEQGGTQFLFNLRKDPHELNNLAGLPSYAKVEKDLIGNILSRLTALTHYTHSKEQREVQRVRI